MWCAAVLLQRARRLLSVAASDGQHGQRAVAGAVRGRERGALLAQRVHRGNQTHAAARRR